MGRRSLEEIEDEDFDFRKREERISKLRGAALAEVWKASGYDGILRLCESGEGSSAIGWVLADGAVVKLDVLDFLYRLASEPFTRSPAHIDACLSGLLFKADDAARDDLLTKLAARFEEEGEAGATRSSTFSKPHPFPRKRGGMWTSWALTTNSVTGPMSIRSGAAMMSMSCTR